MSYITMEIWTGIWILVRLLPTALIIFAGVMIIELGIEFIQKKKIEISIFFFWINSIPSSIIITPAKIISAVGSNLTNIHIPVHISIVI